MPELIRMKKKSGETDKNQNPDDYKLERHQGQNDSKDEYKQPEKKDELTKEQLNKKKRCRFKRWNNKYF